MSLYLTAHCKVVEFYIIIIYKSIRAPLYIYIYIYARAGDRIGGDEKNLQVIYLPDEKKKKKSISYYLNIIL